MDGRNGLLQTVAAAPLGSLRARGPSQQLCSAARRRNGSGNPFPEGGVSGIPAHLESPARLGIGGIVKPIVNIEFICKYIRGELRTRQKAWMSAGFQRDRLWGPPNKTDPKNAFPLSEGVLRSSRFLRISRKRRGFHPGAFGTGQLLSVSSQSSSAKRGGKNSLTGNLIFRNSSQGSSAEETHSLSGTL